MKKMKRILSIIIIVLLNLGSIVGVAGDADIEILSVEYNGGLKRQMNQYISTRRWTEPIESYVFENTDSSFCILDVGDMIINIDTYDANNYELLETNKIDFELDLFGGFYAGENYNYIVFAQDNNEEDNSKTTFKTVKYSKDWQRLDAAEYKNNNTVRFDCGTLRMSEYNGYLYVHAGHTMYKSSDGANHQANITYNVNVENMEVVDEASRVSHLSFAYTSHSFNQFIKVDDKKLIALDHGDAYPRSIKLTISKSSLENGRFVARNDTEYWSSKFATESINLFEIPGEIGANCTGVTVGGFECSDTNYIVAINSIDHSKVTKYTSFDMIGLDKDERDVLLLISSKNNRETSNVKTIYLTDYIDKNKLASTPYLVKVTNDRFIVLWEEFEYITDDDCKSNGTKYLQIDGNGNITNDIKTLEEAHLSSDCQPVQINNSLIWYINESDKRTLYVMDLEEKTITNVTGVTVNKTTLSLEKGSTETLTATVTPANATDKTVAWSTSNSTVATVSNGMVTAKSAGTAVITATTADGGYTAKCAVTVTEPDTNIYTYKVSNGEATITKCSTSASGDIEIPATLDGYPVTSIGYSAFYGCNSLTSIVIPEGVTSIGGSAFDGCSSLTSITIPGSVTSIGSAAFRLCRNLTSITIPEGVTSIAYGTFDNCSSLMSIVIPDGVTSIGESAFVACSKLTSIAVPDSVTRIGDYAFKGCSSLTNIIIPDSVINIGLTAFYGTEFYNNSANWENGILYIGKHLIGAESTISGHCNIKDGTIAITGDAFLSCSELASITIPESMVSIGDMAFGYCSSLTNIAIPDSVTDIGAYAFMECNSLTSITIPDSVTSIGHYTFEGCDNLINITFPEGLTSIGCSMFNECSGLKSITIPKDVTTIEESAFNECRSLTSIIIPKSVTSIQYGAFSNCINILDVYYSGSEEDWKKISIGSNNRCLTRATIHYNSDNTIVKVTGVNLDKTTLMLESGSTSTLTATVTPANATDKTVTWTSSNSTVATVSNGEVTAKSAGTAVITVTTADGGYTAKCTVTVINPAEDVTEIIKSIDFSDTTVSVGKASYVTDDAEHGSVIYMKQDSPSHKSSGTITNTIGGGRGERLIFEADVKYVRGASESAYGALGVKTYAGRAGIQVGLNYNTSKISLITTVAEADGSAGSLRVNTSKTVYYDMPASVVAKGEGKWVKITVDHNALSQTYSVYIDDKLINEVPLLQANMDIGSNGGHAIRGYSMELSGEGEMWVDNVSLCKYTDLDAVEVNAALNAALVQFASEEYRSVLTNCDLPSMTIGKSWINGSSYNRDLNDSGAIKVENPSTYKYVEDGPVLSYELNGKTVSSINVSRAGIADFTVTASANGITESKTVERRVAPVAIRGLALGTVSCLNGVWLEGATGNEKVIVVTYLENRKTDMVQIFDLAALANSEEYRSYNPETGLLKGIGLGHPMTSDTIKEVKIFVMGENGIIPVAHTNSLAD